MQLWGPFIGIKIHSESHFFSYRWRDMVSFGFYFTIPYTVPQEKSRITRFTHLSTVNCHEADIGAKALRKGNTVNSTIRRLRGKRAGSMMWLGSGREALKRWVM